MKILIIGIVLTLLLITSCARVQQVADSTNANNAAGLPTVEQRTGTENMPQNEPIKDSEIAGLIAKSDKVDNYQYFYKETTGTTSSGYKVYFLQNKVRKEYSAPVRVSDTLSYNKVFLDLNTKTAYAVCDTTGVSCDNLRSKIFPINYETEALPFLPHLLPQEITSDAMNDGYELVESRKTLLVEYDGSKMNLDQYSGVAMKYVPKDSEVSYTFTQLGLNSVKESDVTLPKDYEMMK